jgi:hypothetical protein
VDTVEPFLAEYVLQNTVASCQRLVRAEGLEPPQLSSLEPKSSASTNSATPASSIMLAAMPDHNAEKCQRIRAAIMLQVIGIDHVNDFGQNLSNIPATGAAGL